MRIVRSEAAFRCSLLVMHGQPYRRHVGRHPFDSVASEGRTVDEIARLQFDRLVLEPQPSGPFQRDDPLALVLVVPDAIRRCVAVRDDLFDANGLGSNEATGDFVGREAGMVERSFMETLFSRSIALILGWCERLLCRLLFASVP